MGNFHAWVHYLSHQIPLYLKNIAVFDVMKYRYLRGIRQVFDDKNDRKTFLTILLDWYLNLSLIKYWYLSKRVRVWI